MSTSLVKLGLPAKTDLVFRVLAAQGRCKASSLARELGLPAANVAESLEELRAAGLAVLARPTVPRQTGQIWVAAPAERVAEAMRARQIAAVPGFQHPRAPLGPGITHLSREAARSRLAAMVAVTRHEYLAMNPEPVFGEAVLRAAGPLDRQLAGRGVITRVIGVQADNPKLLLPYGGDVSPAKHYRESPRVPMKLIVVDRRIAFFPVDPGDYDRGYLEVTQAPLVESLAQSFDRQWESAAEPSVEESLTPRERALVTLLANGRTDAVAARELSISQRSVSNIVRSLMDRYNVQNRFQLGVVLGARAAVTPPGFPRS